MLVNKTLVYENPWRSQEQGDLRPLWMSPASLSCSERDGGGKLVNFSGLGNLNHPWSPEGLLWEPGSLSIDGMVQSTLKKQDT